MKTLFKNARIINFVDGKLNIIKNGYLAVDGDVISYVGTELPEGDFNRVKDMEGKILMPGIYNCHTHSPMVLLRGVGSDLPLDKWLFGEVIPIEDKLTAEEIRAASDLAMMEMISGGTVSFSDMYFEPGQTAESAAKAGLRANICRPVQSFDPNEKPEDSFRLKEAGELYDKYNGFAEGRIMIDFCIHAEYTCTEIIARAASELCHEKGANMHIHLSETAKEQKECIDKYGVTPAKWFENLGLFENKVFAAHCVVLTDDDALILKNHGASIVHNPSSNMKLGSGFAPVQKYIDMGINVALGTDGAASNNNLSMPEEMHLASIIHNGYNNDATIMNSETILKMATVNGAKLQNREKCGNLLPGYKADIVAFSLDAPHMQPCLDEAALIVYSAGTSDVCMNMVDGKIIYENGVYFTVDTEKTYYNFKKAVEKLYN